VQHGGEEQQRKAEQGHARIMRESRRYGKPLRNCCELGIIRALEA
jgi:hypothetical protein